MSTKERKKEKMQNTITDLHYWFVEISQFIEALDLTAGDKEEAAAIMDGLARAINKAEKVIE